jgi:hypothetical protein
LQDDYRRLGGDGVSSGEIVVVERIEESERIVALTEMSGVAKMRSGEGGRSSVKMRGAHVLRG